MDKARQRAKILVVDDDPFPYENLFKRDGYSLEYWQDVESIDRLTEDDFDVVILDMSGVGRDYAARDQGIGVLRHIKTKAPWKIVIAYSGKKWALQQHADLKLANLVIDKGLDYVDFRKHVDDLLRHRFSEAYYVDRASHILTLASASIPPGFTLMVSEALSTRATDRLESSLSKASVDQASIALVVEIIQLAIGTATLFAN